MAGHDPLFFAQDSEVALISVFIALFMSWRAVYYLSLRACIDSQGMTLHHFTTRRRIEWLDIDGIIYASRALIYDGVRTPRQVSLQLLFDDQPPVGLPHRFKNMGTLFNQVREQVEPVVMKKMEQRLDNRGSTSGTV